ncbi:hypothetical protein, conserved [Eimeria praecox]|uniref:Uncharacterized protein n=1 Tax=Eimeria praecox TaxID=51316 RepID=U6H8D9_9EIME|nr:hypothetical protein, conserved [Eimeria praecox]
MRRSPASPRGEKRESMSDGKGPPSRGPSSKSTPRGKSQKESAAVGEAKKGSESPRGNPPPPPEESYSPGHSSEEPSLCPSGDRAHQEVCPSRDGAHQEVCSSKDGAHQEVCPSKDGAHQEVCPSRDRAHQEVCPSRDRAHQEVCPSRDRDHQEACQPSPPHGSSVPQSPHRELPSPSGPAPAETPETTLQKQNFELMRQNNVLRQALLKYMSSEELLFLLAYSTTHSPSDAGEDSRSLQDHRHPLKGSITDPDAPPTEPETSQGDEEHWSKARNIDLPCVKDFFRAVKCCGLPSHEAPPVEAEGAPEAAAANSSPRESLTTHEGDTPTKDTSDSTPIAVDFDPFGSEKEDDTEAQTPPKEAESQRSSSSCCLCSVSSSTTSTNLQRRALEGVSLPPVPVLGVMSSPHRAASLGALNSALPHPRRPRAKRGSMFYPSTYRLAAFLPRAFPP